MKFKYNPLFFVGLFCLSFTSSLMALQVTPSEEEKTLYNLVTQYRADNGLPGIPFSVSLTHVAQTHVRDLSNYPPSSGCNLHSWSSAGAWTSCCYTSDHSQDQCMWDKPGELSSYPGSGYEIAAGGGSSVISAETALQLWQSSAPHNDVILNQGMWANTQWQAMGVGIYGGYAVIWFGMESDPAGTLDSGTSSPPPSSSGKLGQLSTRGYVTSDQPMQAGFIIGEANVDVVVAVWGPSLAEQGVSGNWLANPRLKLFQLGGSSPQQLAEVDNWQEDNAAASVYRLGLAPEHTLEPATMKTLPPGSYTVVIDGTNASDSGEAIVGLWRLSSSEGKLAQLSTRGYASSNTPMQAGFMISDANTEVTIAVWGPSLPLRGVAGTWLSDPIMKLFKLSNAGNSMLREVDDWNNDSTASQVQALGLAPEHSLEPATLQSLEPGSYTVVLNGYYSNDVGEAIVGIWQKSTSSGGSSPSPDGLAFQTNLLLDNETHLMWQDDTHHRTAPWTAAQEYCQTLTLGGYVDWRLPTQDELAVILNKLVANNLQFQALGPDWCFIGGTDQATKAVAINAQSGLQIGDKFNTTETTTRAVRCVRNQ